MIDTLAMARTRHPGAKHSLDALCTRYGIDRSHRVKHGALLDAQLLAQLYVELTRRAADRAGAGAMRRPRRSRSARSRRSRRRRRVRPIRAAAAACRVDRRRLERHEAFVATLINPVWDAAAPCG